MITAATAEVIDAVIACAGERLGFQAESDPVSSKRSDKSYAEN